MKRTTIAGLALIAAIALLTLTGCPEAGLTSEATGPGDPLDTLDGWWLATNVNTGVVILDAVVNATENDYEFLIFEEGELIEGSVRGTYEIAESAIVTTDVEEYDDLWNGWISIPVDDRTEQSRPYTHSAALETVRFSVGGVRVTFRSIAEPVVDLDIVGSWDAAGFGSLDLGSGGSYGFWSDDQDQWGTWKSTGDYILVNITGEGGGGPMPRVMELMPINTYSFHRYTYSSGADQLTIHFPDGDVVFNREMLVAR